MREVEISSDWRVEKEYNDGQLIKEIITNSDGSVYVYDYNDAGQMIKETRTFSYSDGRVDVALFVYNESGKRIRVN